MNTTTRIASLLVRYPAAVNACQVAREEWERAYDAGALDAMCEWLGIWQAAAQERLRVRQLLDEAFATARPTEESAS